MGKLVSKVSKVLLKTYIRLQEVVFHTLIVCRKFGTKRIYWLFRLLALYPFYVKLKS